MRHTGKRVLSGAICVALLFSCVLVGASAAEKKTGTYESLTYVVENNAVTITRCSTSASGQVEIPAEIQNCPVTAIGNKAFYDCQGVTAVTIPKGVTTIGTSAFQYCTRLNQVSLPSTLTTIGNYAFESCTSLTAVTVPEGVSQIGTSAFASCTALSAVSLPKTLNTLGKNAFMDCTSLKTISIPSRVSSLETGTFSGCTSLTTISLPDGLTTIGKECFLRCTALVRVVIPSSVTRILASAFRECTSLSSVRFSQGLVEIGARAFYDCTSLKQIVLPTSATQVASDAFGQGSNGAGESVALEGVTVTTEGTESPEPTESAQVSPAVESPTVSQNPGTVSQEAAPAESQTTSPGAETTSPTVETTSPGSTSSGTKSESAEKNQPSVNPLETADPLLSLSIPADEGEIADPVGTDSDSLWEDDQVSYDTPVYISQTYGTSASTTSGSSTSSGSSSGKSSATQEETITLPFTDVTESDFYYEALCWAVEKGVPVGTSDTTFSPELLCTRAQFITFLWAAVGSPEPETECPFSDVTEEDYCYQAVCWAAENGVTAGTSPTTFSPDQPCTRGEIATFLWANAQRPQAEEESRFTDLETGSQGWYASAARWSTEQGIIYPTSTTTFSPHQYCNRGQAIAMLYRGLVEEAR
jgi:hypothetical protein